MTGRHAGGDTPDSDDCPFAAKIGFMPSLAVFPRDDGGPPMITPAVLFAFKDQDGELLGQFAVPSPSDQALRRMPALLSEAVEHAIRERNHQLARRN